LGIGVVSAQSTMDSILMEQSKLEAENNFKRVVNENALIYSGNEYVEFISMESSRQIVYGSPYFIADSLIDGTVDYNGVQYSLPIKFHLIDQKLIVNHPITHSPIELLNENINHFSIGTHTFYKIPKGLNSLMPSKQIYAEQLFNRHFELWVLHEKLLRSTKKAEDQTANYIIYDQFVIQKNGIWIKLKSEKDVLNFCQDKKNKVQEYVLKQSIDFNRNFESAMIEVLKYYDSIDN
jgi:hypothetical protein